MKRILTLLVPALLLAASCAREPLTDAAAVPFCLRLEKPVTRSGADTLLYRDSMLVDLVATDHPCGPDTKAAPANALYERVGVYGYRYASWTGQTPPTLLCNAQLVRNGSVWYSDRPMAGGAGGSDLYMRFYSYGPYDAPGLVPECSGGAPSFTYHVPADVHGQADLVMGESGELPADATSVDMTFRHVLSSVCLAVDDACTDAVIKTVEVKGIYGEGRYVPGEGWSGLTAVSDYSMQLDSDVSAGVAAAITSGESTLMLIPQTFPQGATLVLGLEVEGESKVIEAPLAGISIEPGCSYLLRMNFHVTAYDSIFTFRVNMNHRSFSSRSGANFWLPRMFFESGTEELTVDWGDGKTDKVAKSFSAEFHHNFPSNHVGDVVLKVKGTSPRISPDGSFIQFITEIEIEGNERYSSQCNCIVEDATSTLVYAGRDFSFPTGVTRLGPFCLPGIEQSTLVVPEGITYACKNAFSGPNAYTNYIQLPASLTVLEDGAFIGAAFYSATVSDDNPNYYVDSGCIMERSSSYVVCSTMYSSVPTYAQGVRPYAFGTSSYDVNLPDCCTDIMDHAFHHNGRARNISLPDGCTVGDYCFELVSSAIEFRGTIAAGMYSFYKCSGITELDLSHFTSLGAYCFSDCKSIEILDIPIGFRIPSYAFSGCSGIQTLEVPASCTVESNAFEYCTSLRRLTLESSLMTGLTFVFCSSLSELVLKDGFVSCHQSSFRSAPLTDIRIYCQSMPAVAAFELTSRNGVVHVPAGQDYSSWMQASGLTAKGWTWTDDL